MTKPIILPDKLYFKIREVAKLSDVKQHVLRYWESEFSSIRPQKSKTNQRLYKRRDVEAVIAVKHLLYDRKFTIEGAKRFLKEKGIDNALPAPDPQKVAALARDSALAEVEDSVLRVRGQMSSQFQKSLLGLRKELTDFITELDAEAADAKD